MLLLLAGLLQARDAAAGVSVFDQLATTDQPFYLKLRTHRGPLAMGGVRGAFWIDGQKAGQVLTGADGYGFLKYTATATGTYVLAARTAAGDAEARLRVVTRSDPVVLFEIETLLWHMLVRNREGNAGRILNQVARDFELVYLCGPTGRGAARQLITERKLPDRIILAGKDRDMFATLARRGVHIFAVVGSARFMSAARDFSPRRLSFEKTAQARHVADWNDLLKQINQKGESP